MKYKKIVAALLLIVAFPKASHAFTDGSHHRENGGLGNIPEIKTTVSIGLIGVTTVDIYCAGDKKKRPKHPQAKGKIQVILPDNAPPLIAGDGARKVANQWIHNPDPLPPNPTSVTFTCGISKELSSGVYGFTWDANWAPNPAPCWSTPAFTLNVSGGIVVPNSDGTGGDIYVPKLKSTTIKVAPDHTDRMDQGRSRVEVGVGEFVNLDVKFVPTLAYVDWARSGDADGLNLGQHGLSNVFRAIKPNGSTGSATITAVVTTDWGNFVIDKTFSVLRPSEITIRRWLILTSVPLGTIGADMEVKYKIKPTNVSFNNIYVRERGVAGTPEVAPQGVTGYFSYVLSVFGGQDLEHKPTVGWSRPDEFQNEFADHASLNGFRWPWPPPTPYAPSGSYYWKIPVVWEVDNTLPGEFLDYVNQVFDLAADGTVTITKREAHITRGINEPDGH